MKFLMALIFSFNILNATEVCPRDRSDYFCLSVEMAPNSIVTQQDFYLIPIRIMEVFRAELKELKYPVVLDARWESPYFGAGVNLYNDKFSIMILGGLARMEGMTLNAYAALVCHELGHIIGGPPYQTNIESAQWASVEGQADYFAASVCLPRYLKLMGHENHELPDLIEEAGYDLFETIKRPSSLTRDETIIRWLELKEEAVEMTRGYPSMQCRYETFRAPHSRSKCWYSKNRHL